MAKALAIVGKVAFVVGVIFAIVGGIWGGEAEPTNRVVIIALLASGVAYWLAQRHGQGSSCCAHGCSGLDHPEHLGLYAGFPACSQTVSGAGGERRGSGRLFWPAHGAGSHHHRHQGGDFNGEAWGLIPFQADSAVRSDRLGRLGLSVNSCGR